MFHMGCVCAVNIKKLQFEVIYFTVTHSVHIQRQYKMHTFIVLLYDTNM